MLLGGVILLISAAYLGILFAIAYWGDKRRRRPLDHREPVHLRVVDGGLCDLLDLLRQHNANLIDMTSLNDMDRRMLNESLRVARRLQQRMRLDYGRRHGAAGLNTPAGYASRNSR